jgi:hypothetical protein
METTDEERTLLWLKIAGEIIILSVLGYQAWKLLVPDYVSERIRAGWRRRWEDLHSPDRERRARNAVVFDLMEVAEACPHELGAEITRLRHYDRGHHDTP